jgi:hypothetical protein
MRVEAYSGICSGQAFEVNVGERSFLPVDHEVDGNDNNSPTSVGEDENASEGDGDEEDNGHEIELNWVAVISAKGRVSNSVILDLTVFETKLSVIGRSGTIGKGIGG